MKPLIGITCSYNNDGNYTLASQYSKAIEAAGGMPVILTYTKDISDLREILLYIDGLLLTGGGDVDPVFFGEEPIGTGVITPQRDIFEIEATQMAIDRGYPVLGICRGMQVINIVAGGKIHQCINGSIENPIKHMQEAPRWYPTHRIEVKAKTILAEMLGTGEIRVNSFHHQVASHVAPEYIASAYASDGAIEAIESNVEKFVVGIQCHPEHLWEKNEKFIRLFKFFVNAAK